MEKINVIIMAGGLGKRMNSNLPKVLHLINNKPIIINIIETIINLNLNKIFIIVGKYKDIIKSTIEKYIINDIIEYIIQENPLGTGNAIQCCYNNLCHKFKSLILSGDVPLIKKDTLEKMIDYNSKCILLTCEIEKPFGYGRIIRENNKFLKIVEEKDCSDKEKKIYEINSGIYLIDNNYIIDNIKNIKNNNNQKEYYLTDLFKILKEKDIHIDILKLNTKENYQIKGVNTMEELNDLKKYI